MKKVMIALTAVGFCMGLAGCSSPPKVDSDDSVFDYMQEQVDKISGDGGMAAVGVGRSRSTSTALAKAKLEARKNLAQLVSVKIENLEKAFVEEVGEASGSEMNELFSSATKQITSQEIQGSVPKIQKYENKEGETVAYVLMIMNPDIVHEALKRQSNNAKHLYERFRASRAFEELDKEIKEFEAAEQAGWKL
jgi:hypothetical protein